MTGFLNLNNVPNALKDFKASAFSMNVSVIEYDSTIIYTKALRSDQ